MECTADDDLASGGLPSAADIMDGVGTSQVEGGSTMTRTTATAATISRQWQRKVA